jgi:hypothetical protein
MIAIAFHFICVVCACFKSRRRLEAEILVLRHQLNVLQQRAHHADCMCVGPTAPLFIWLYRRCANASFASCTRPIERFGDVVAHPILGGLHHRYARI